MGNWWWVGRRSQLRLWVGELVGVVEVVEVVELVEVVGVEVEANWW